MTDKFTNLKYWEKCATVPEVHQDGAHLITGGPEENELMYVNSGSQVQIYSSKNDAWVEMNKFGGPTFGPGSCGVYHPKSFTLNCTKYTAPGNGTFFNGDGVTQAAEFPTNLTLLANLAVAGTGKKFEAFVISGYGAGTRLKIVGNTTGPNSKIYLHNTSGTTPGLDTDSVVVFYTGRYYLLNAGGSLGTGSFQYFDYATQTWGDALSITGLPTTWNTSGSMTHCTSYLTYGPGIPAYTGSTASYITYPGNSPMVVNRYRDAVLLSVSGVNNGLSRKIASNGVTNITVVSPFPSTPGNFDLFKIVGDEDIIYLTGNDSDILYSYIPSTDTWSAVSVDTPRGGNAGPGTSLDFIYKSSGANGPLVNHSHLLSARGGSVAYDIYNIGLRTWTQIPSAKEGSDVQEGGWVYDSEDTIYGHLNTTNTTRPKITKFDLSYQSNIPVSVVPAKMTINTSGLKLGIISSWSDNVLQARFLYYVMPATNTMYRTELYNRL